MAVNIYICSILFALLSFGMAVDYDLDKPKEDYSKWKYSIFHGTEQQEAMLNATLDIYKSVNKNPETSDINEESKLLASKLLSFFKQTLGIGFNRFETLSNRFRFMISFKLSTDNISMILGNDDSKLREAQQRVDKIENLFTTKYSGFLKNYIFPNETQVMIREVLELDNEQSFELSQAMSNVYKLYLEKYRKNEKEDYEILGESVVFFTAFCRNNWRNEFREFMMMTTAYKLKSLESNDDNYVKEFERLRKQLNEKLAIDVAKMQEALSPFKNHFY